MSHFQYLNDGDGKCIGRMSTPRVVIDNESCKNATVIQVDRADKPGILLEIVQVLGDLNLPITKSYNSSDGGRFMDVFNVTDQNGNKITEEGILDHIKKSLGPDVCFTSSERRSVEVTPSMDHTSIELFGTDGPGLLSEGLKPELCTTDRVVPLSDVIRILPETSLPVTRAEDLSHLGSRLRFYAESSRRSLADAISKFCAVDTFVKEPARVYHGDTPADKWVPFEKLAFPEFLMNDDDEESGGGGEKYYVLKVDPHFQARVSTDMQLKKFDDQRRIHLVQNGEWALKFLEDEGYRSFVKEFEDCLLRNRLNAGIMGQSSPKEVPLDPGFLTRRSIDEWAKEAKLLLGLSASACYASPSTFPRVANGLGFAACLVAVSLRHTAGGAVTSFLVKFGALGCVAGVLAVMAKDLPQEYILVPIVAFLLIAAVVARAR